MSMLSYKGQFQSLYKITYSKQLIINYTLIHTINQMDFAIDEDGQIQYSDDVLADLQSLSDDLEFYHSDTHYQASDSLSSVKLNTSRNVQEVNSSSYCTPQQIKAKYGPIKSESDNNAVQNMKSMQEGESSSNTVKVKHFPKEAEKDSLNSYATAVLPIANMGRTSKSSKPKIHKAIDTQICDKAEQLLKAGLTANEIRQKLNLSQRSMKKLQAQFQLYGKLVPSKGISNNPRITMQKEKEYLMVQQILKGLITKNCSITLRHMQKALRQNGIVRSRSTIHAYLAKMRFSRKKLQKIPLERNSFNKIVYRQNYCKMIQQIPLSKQVFLDETIFGLQTAGHYGWAPKGQQPKVFVPASRRKHITLLAAISIRGFEATKIIKGPVTSKHVCQFLQHYLDHLEPDEILILDNARMHHAAVVKQKIKQLNRPVRYIPAYTPQLNPIENVFSEIKVQYVRLKEDHDLKSQDMIRLIEQAIKNMRSKQFSKYYEHYQQHLRRGVAGQLFS